MHGIQARADADELAAILRVAFGERRHGVAAGMIPEGHINDTRQLTWPDGSRRILRVAPSDAAVVAGPSWLSAFGLRREAAVIAAAPELAPYLPVTVAYDFERSVIDRDWVIQEVMPGRQLSEVDRLLAPGARADVWRSIGAFTRRLHMVTGAHFGPPAWGPAFERWSGLLEWDVQGLIEDAGRFGYRPDPFRRLGEAIARNRDRLDQVHSPRLIHSDLSTPHIFVDAIDGHWQLTGVIDLEFGRFADPASEYLISGFAWDTVPAVVREAFMAAYRPKEDLAADHWRAGIYAVLAQAWFAPLLSIQGEPVERLLRDIDRALDRLDDPAT